ncbi:hypothetical protein RvY_16145 [Ramazzottius varieornatus]|uniref:Uncharacterized protein n=1 Tax=Ramazzottius varieornatus TaxID=947166 RepID=A0A1D1W0E7_RAMVA|nr:hypothetical protein RvY_16145 [Ramazzottius varieornatus]
MFMTGDIRLRNRLFKIVTEHIKLPNVPIPHFFCAGGSRYEDTGPHRPWFTQFAQPHSPESAHYVYLSDPCFFDDFAGVVIPEFLPIDQFRLKERLPHTPQEEEFYSRLQPIPGSPGFHPNFSRTKGASVVPGNDSASQNRDGALTDRACNNPNSTKNPRDKMDAYKDLGEEMHIQAMANQPTTSKASPSPRKRRPDDDPTSHQSKQPKHDSSDTSTSSPDSSAVDSSICPKPRNRKRNNNKNFRQRNDRSSADRTDPVPPLVQQPKILAPNVQAPIHPDWENRVIACLVDRWFVFSLKDMQSYVNLNPTLRFWYMDKYLKLKPTTGRMEGLRSHMSALDKDGLDVPRFFKEGDDVVIKVFTAENSHFVLMSGHYMKPVEKNAIDKHISGKCEGATSLGFSKCICFKGPESKIAKTYDPQAEARSLSPSKPREITFPNLPFPGPERPVPEHPNRKTIIAFNSLLEGLPDWVKLAADKLNLNWEDIPTKEYSVLMKLPTCKGTMGKPHRRTLTKNSQSGIYTRLPLFYTLPEDPTTVRKAVIWVNQQAALVVMADHYLKLVPVEILEYFHTPERCEGAVQGDLAKCRCFEGEAYVLKYGKLFKI